MQITTAIKQIQKEAEFQGMGLLETLQAMRACGSDELHRDERLALRCLMDGFQQMLAPVQNG